MFTDKSAQAIAEEIAQRRSSTLEIIQQSLGRIAALDPTYGAFLKVDVEGALSSASQVDRRIADGETLPLAGVPIAIKDNISTRGIETTCASKILKGYVPPFDATVVDRLKRAGAVVIGKTNLDEFAMGGSTETSAYQVTRNPWDPSRSPGGSSGGSAVAVSAAMTPVSLGSDTGGSIRQPASLCGVVGFKPSYGRVSRYGLVAFGSSLDQIGPFARTVEDAALVASVISGHDPLDSTSVPMKSIRIESLKEGTLAGKRFALPEEMFSEEIHPGVRECLEVAFEAIRRAGATVDTVSLPSVKLGVTTYYIIAPCEASSNLGRFDGIRYGPRAAGASHTQVVERTRAQGFGHEVKTRIMIGTYALSAGYYDAYYLRAQQVRALMRQEFDQVFATYDGVLSPTSPVPAFYIGEMEKDPMALKILDFCTIPANMGGLPGISLPCGMTEGLPVGLQLMTPPLSDEALLQTAYCIERVVPPVTLPPNLP